MNKFSVLLKSLAALCYPPRCLCCDTPLAHMSELLFCSRCFADIDFINEPFCPRCGRAFPNAAGDNHLCGKCLTNPPQFAGARAVAHFKPPLTDAIHAFKYNNRTYGLASFSKLCRQLSPPLVETDLIIPVPLHQRRLRERGFNQALLLARAFFPEARKKIMPQLLVRHKWTEPQTSLSGTNRRRNLKGCFSVVDSEKVKGKSVLLVDDVFTTGSTANECARTLKKAGVTVVHILTLARVPE